MLDKLQINKRAIKEMKLCLHKSNKAGETQFSAFSHSQLYTLRTQRKLLTELRSLPRRLV